MDRYYIGDRAVLKSWNVSVVDMAMCYLYFEWTSSYLYGGSDDGGGIIQREASLCHYGKMRVFEAPL